MKYQAADRGATYLLVLSPLIGPTFTGHLACVIPPSIRIVHPIKLGAPYLNNLCEPLEKNQLDLLVQFRDPVFKVGVTLQVQPIDLYKAFSQTASSKRLLRTAAWIWFNSSVNASVVYEQVERSSTARDISLYRSMTLLVLSYRHIRKLLGVHQVRGPSPVTPRRQRRTLGRIECVGCLEHQRSGCISSHRTG